ncbi:PTS mannose transporter subunit IIA [Staphylococcus saprophyticus]|uniref:PTS lactose/cellobiose transporter subunit IIA n=1 Tax=Staphylococcus saprophyticus TaxID=29385 RepID=UPI0007D98573|nr:PTS lactose/cellobiose transporter subunit IIA [Staphylococcus saprophyticus]MDW3796905.1 PTS lactose/cellobiose transporter subunit IIA [Staphylococcus saprophyticus]MDW4012216.1 PTS lactose/cellobiose transporter subunit IIA [Staphylococcus saprophyticus]MDW4186646.1 PTS lactose/cellobiose transporter subunit IIA [Staphylococcus saprophyticus]MEB5700938.1 PTS lactose/cellobiose transporter subunit IIA [Staphylococcus saprophyticus]OAO34537.1 PTS mannose transporter subunit IIA [Staphyloco
MSEAENSLEFAMSLIAYSGDAKSHAMEAIYVAKKNAFEEAEKKLKLAEVSLLEAHHIQTNMLTKEAQGDEIKMSLLTIHSQDHLMTAITFKDMAAEMIDLYKKMDSKA